MIWTNGIIKSGKNVISFLLSMTSVYDKIKLQKVTGIRVIAINLILDKIRTYDRGAVNSNMYV